MQIDLTKKEFRRLLDLVYIGNWILNSIRGDDRFADYDHLEDKLFGLCHGTGMQALVEKDGAQNLPSQAFVDGGIHEAIACYEDAVFFNILAQELSHRDMGYPDITAYNRLEFILRSERYMQLFEESGVDHLFYAEEDA